MYPVVYQLVPSHAQQPELDTHARQRLSKRKLVDAMAQSNLAACEATQQAWRDKSIEQKVSYALGGN
jgi:hypothetical protein